MLVTRRRNAVSYIPLRLKEIDIDESEIEIVLKNSNVARRSSYDDADDDHKRATTKRTERTKCGLNENNMLISVCRLNEVTLNIGRFP